jgi:hypothetical protein
MAGAGADAGFAVAGRDGDWLVANTEMPTENTNVLASPNKLLFI